MYSMIYSKICIHHTTFRIILQKHRRTQTWVTHYWHITSTFKFDALTPIPDNDSSLRSLEAHIIHLPTCLLSVVHMLIWTLTVWTPPNSTASSLPPIHQIPCRQEVQNDFYFSWAIFTSSIHGLAFAYVYISAFVQTNF